MSKMSKILKLELKSRRIANIYMQLAHNLKYLIHQKYVLTQNRATSLLIHILLFIKLHKLGKLHNLFTNTISKNTTRLMQRLYCPRS